MLDLPQSTPGVEDLDAAVCGQFEQVSIPGYYEARSGFDRALDHPVIVRVFLYHVQPVARRYVGSVIQYIRDELVYLILIKAQLGIPEPSP